MKSRINLYAVLLLALALTLASPSWGMGQADVVITITGAAPSNLGSLTIGICYDDQQLTPLPLDPASDGLQHALLGALAASEVLAMAAPSGTLGGCAESVATIAVLSGESLGITQAGDLASVRFTRISGGPMSGVLDADVIDAVDLVGRPQAAPVLAWRIDAVAVCGDTNLDAGEQCDDGNTVDGDCCSASCQFEAPGSACSDNDACMVQDACDGAGTCLAIPLICDDDNLCTDETCDSAAGCVYTPNSDACDDGNACTANDACSDSACQPGEGVVCDDENVCTTETCDQALGCVYTPNSDACDDGNACTANDVCSNSACQPGEGVVCDDANVCTTDTCDMISGCAYTPNTKPCDDGNLCTTGDVCSNGFCVSDGELECDDSNVCTTEACDPDLGCVTTPNSRPCSDGDLCTDGDTCANSECVSGPSVSCEDENICTTGSCNPAIGCEQVFNSLACDDGDACTTLDVCSGGSCVGSGQLDCDDENGCTENDCDPSQGCLNTSNTTPCTDGSLCTEGDVCADGSCQPGADVDCDDFNPCTAESCDDLVGCTNDRIPDCTSEFVNLETDMVVQPLGASIPVALALAFAEATTGGTVEVRFDVTRLLFEGFVFDDELGDDPALRDHSGLGTDEDPLLFSFGSEAGLMGTLVVGELSFRALVSGAAAVVSSGSEDVPFLSLGAMTEQLVAFGQATILVEADCGDGSVDLDEQCDDGNVDNGDCCSSTCRFEPVQSACDDGSVCTSADTCDGAGACLPGAEVSCDDDNVCTDGTCDPVLGCQHTPNSAPCDDGDVCTTGDVCSDSVCIEGGRLDCDDGNVCTDDACNPVSGCVNPPNSDPCSDGNACTIADTCIDSRCLGSGTLMCDDGNACTDPSCNPAVGCEETPNTDSCDDGDTCTTIDVCSAGACLGSGALDCDDLDVCTADGCDEVLGCVHDEIVECNSEFIRISAEPNPVQADAALRVALSMEFQESTSGGGVLVHFDEGRLGFESFSFDPALGDDPAFRVASAAPGSGSPLVVAFKNFGAEIVAQRPIGEVVFTALAEGSAVIATEQSPKGLFLPFEGGGPLAVDFDDFGSVSVEVVPEPGALAAGLAVLGALVLAARRRRR